MNTFAGNITLKGNQSINGLDFDYVENLSVDGNKVLFVFGDTEIKTSQELVDFFKEKFGELINYDISISTEDKIEVFGGDYEEGVYELASFEGEQVDYKEILDRFQNFDGVVSVREAEISKKFGNRVIKVDFVF